MAALPILKAGCCWRVGDGSSIKIKADRWIPNYPANRVLHSVSADVDVDDRFVSELIDQDLHWWKRDLMSTIFHRENVDAICRIPLSRRQVGDSIFWLHTRMVITLSNLGIMWHRKFLSMKVGLNALVEVICSRYGKSCGR